MIVVTPKLAGTSLAQKLSKPATTFSNVVKAAPVKIVTGLFGLKKSPTHIDVTPRGSLRV
jgi:hypothetical protein